MYLIIAPKYLMEINFNYKKVRQFGVISGWYSVKRLQSSWLIAHINRERYYKAFE